MAEMTTNLITIMSTLDKEILEKNRDNIRHLLDVKDVLDHLVETKILNNQDCEILRDNKRKAPDLLVDLLLQNRTSAALLEFTTALKKAGGYDTLLYVLGQHESGSDSKSDTDDDKEDTSSRKTEKFYMNKIKQQSIQIKQLQEQLARERQEKENLQKMVSELVKRAGKKDKKIKELKSQIKEHENRIQDLEECLRKGSKENDERFADHGDKLDALTQRIDRLDTNRPVYVGNVGTTIQTHVHNPEEPSDVTPVSSAQPTGDRSYLNSRQLTHLSRPTPTQSKTPRTPRSARSKKKQ